MLPGRVRPLQVAKALAVKAIRVLSGVELVLELDAAHLPVRCHALAAASHRGEASQRPSDSEMSVATAAAVLEAEGGLHTRDPCGHLYRHAVAVGAVMRNAATAWDGSEAGARSHGIVWNLRIRREPLPGHTTALDAAHTDGTLVGARAPSLTQPTNTVTFTAASVACVVATNLAGAVRHAGARTAWRRGLATTCRDRIDLTARVSTDALGSVSPVPKSCAMPTHRTAATISVAVARGIAETALAGDGSAVLGNALRRHANHRPTEPGRSVAKR